MKLWSSERFSWPSLGFELQRGENVLPPLAELPEPVQRKLGRFIETGVVRVLDNVHAAAPRDELASGVQELVVVEPGEPRRVAVGDVDDGSAGPPSRRDTGTSHAQAPAEEDGSVADGAALELAEFGRVMGHPIRAEIVLRFASGRTFDFAELGRRLGKPASTISEHVAALERAGIVKCSGVRKRRYRVDLAELARLKKLIPT